jgi:hypothetical protein
MPTNSTTSTPIGSSEVRPDAILGRIPAPFRHLAAAVFRDYATLVLQQASVRTLPTEIHRAYEGLYGSPLHVETLALDLRILASAVDTGEG